MGKIAGFLEVSRELPGRRGATERVRDWVEYEGTLSKDRLVKQAGRCMDCGVPMCHSACPLGNFIPEWNALVHEERWREAALRLHATNSFPDITGRVCPAPCESACVLAANSASVTIKQLERQLADAAFENGWIAPAPPSVSTGRRVAVVGSGPAGLACAKELRRAGHEVQVFERQDRLGGLLRYGIPDFKLEKWRIDRHLELLAAEGVVFHTGASVGGSVALDDLDRRFDAVCLAVGANAARELGVPGRALGGIHLAMPYLEQQNRRVATGDAGTELTAAGKRVVILGGGDTGADCLGTALRQGATSVTQLELLPRPRVLRSSGAHEEGGSREFGVLTKEFVGEHGQVTGVRTVGVEWGDSATRREVPASERVLPADLVLLALGFEGPEPGPLAALGRTKPSIAGQQPEHIDYSTGTPGVFACGDMRRGPSLVVWALAEGAACARAASSFLALAPAA